MSAQKSIDRLDQITEQHPHSPASTKVTLTLDDVRLLKSRICWLTDMVVGAAALHSGELEGSEADLMAEELSEVADDLKRTTPWLKAAKR